MDLRRVTTDKKGRLPNAVIIGAMRSGTSSIAHYLGKHPMIFMAPQKEVHFFDRNFSKGLLWYEEQFAMAGSERVICEATQTYMYEQLALRRLAEFLPEARLIAILRNPVDRAYSHYWLNRAQGKEILGFSEAIEAEPARLASGDSQDRMTYSYVDRGKYLIQLESVCSYFPRDALKVVLFDDLLDDPEGTYRVLCDFLEVDSHLLPSEVGRVVNSFRMFRSLRTWQLAKRLPPRMRRAVGRFNAREEPYPAMDHATRERLCREYEVENRALSEWLGRDLSPWAREVT